MNYGLSTRCDNPHIALRGTTMARFARSICASQHLNVTITHLLPMQIFSASLRGLWRCELHLRKARGSAVAVKQQANSRLASVAQVVRVHAEEGLDVGNGSSKGQATQLHRARIAVIVHGNINHIYCGRNVNHWLWRRQYKLVRRRAC